MLDESEQIRMATIEFGSHIVEDAYKAVGLPWASVTPELSYDELKEQAIAERHPDFAVADAERVGADCLVTNDQNLLKHSPVATLSCVYALAYLKTLGVNLSRERGTGERVV